MRRWSGVPHFVFDFLSFQAIINYFTSFSLDGEGSDGMYWDWLESWDSDNLSNEMSSASQTSSDSDIISEEKYKSSFTINLNIPATR